MVPDSCSGRVTARPEVSIFCGWNVREKTTANVSTPLRCAQHDKRLATSAFAIVGE